MGVHTRVCVPQVSTSKIPGKSNGGREKFESKEQGRWKWRFLAELEVKPVPLKYVESILTPAVTPSILQTST